MERNEDLKTLIDAFLGYRDLLTPIVEGLKDTVSAYDSMKEDISKLNIAFGGTMTSKLDQIYETLSFQAKRSTDLSSRIDSFVKTTGKYGEQMDGFIRLFSQVEQKISAINGLEEQAREQIKRLDAIIEEKKINYNLRDLQKTLEVYNNNVQKVSDFINKDVADVLRENKNKIDAITVDHEKMRKKLDEENSTVVKLIETFSATNELLRKISEKQDVNEAYVFDILDRWAESRHIKTKR